jgi:hypothetical protein
LCCGDVLDTIAKAGSVVSMPFGIPGWVENTRLRSGKMGAMSKRKVIVLFLTQVVVSMVHAELPDTAAAELRRV